MARTPIPVSDKVLEAVDEKVGKRGRSRFIEQATREKLERLALEQAIRDTAGIASGPEYVYWDDPEEWVRSGRSEDRR